MLEDKFPLEQRILQALRIHGNQISDQRYSYVVITTYCLVLY